jgi:hypothetical protein
MASILVARRCRCDENCRRNSHCAYTIPNESFKNLPARLKSATDARIATKFYEAMARALRRHLRAGTHECPDNAEIARLIGRCRTTSTRYGPDGTKPFFHHWRRANPSTQNLNKIGDHFGHAIRDPRASSSMQKM